MQNKKPKNTDWLQRIRFTSWELEILLVGFVLVILFQVPDKIQVWSTSKMFYNSTLTSTVDFIINHGVTSIAAVALSFIKYIILSTFVYSSEISIGGKQYINYNSEWYNGNIENIGSKIIPHRLIIKKRMRVIMIIFGINIKLYLKITINFLFSFINLCN